MGNIASENFNLRFIILLYIYLKIVGLTLITISWKCIRVGNVWWIKIKIVPFWMSFSQKFVYMLDFVQFWTMIIVSFLMVSRCFPLGQYGSQGPRGCLLQTITPSLNTSSCLVLSWLWDKVCEGPWMTHVKFTYIASLHKGMHKLSMSIISNWKRKHTPMVYLSSNPTSLAEFDNTQAYCLEGDLVSLLVINGHCLFT